MPYPSKRESVELVAEDLARLDAEEFLNDTCIDFYIK
jgi:Ulp1 family protease